MEEIKMEEKKSQIACDECGSTEFYLFENVCHKAELIKGSLEIYKGDGETTEIICSKCDKGFSEKDFNQIEW